MPNNRRALIRTDHTHHLELPTELYKATSSVNDTIRSGVRVKIEVDSTIAAFLGVLASVLWRLVPYVQAVLAAYAFYLVCCAVGAPLVGTSWFTTGCIAVTRGVLSSSFWLVKTIVTSTSLIVFWLLKLVLGVLGLVIHGVLWTFGALVYCIGMLTKLVWVCMGLAFRECFPLIGLLT